MMIHHQKHHQAYIDTLNATLEKYPEFQAYNLEELLLLLPTFPTTVKTVIQNHGGGHYNHALFWQLLSPNFEQKPSQQFSTLIDNTFGSFAQFQDEFTKAARSCFGSGWVWLCLDANNALKIMTSPNQDNPLSQEIRPVIGLDVWEHAYYLKYQNKRMDYVQAWWHVLNWQRIEEIYALALASK
jgi:Fe-Mn family superoxide dismutase